MTLSRHLRLIGVAVVIAAAPAAAQSPPSPRPPTGAAQPAPPAPVDPKACAPGERSTIGSGQTTLQPPNPNSGESLSDKLARTDGVICPPANVDPEIRAPTPGGGAIQVIPPPGSPGGDPSIRPK